MNYLTTGEVAKLIGVSKRTLQNWLKQQKIETPQKAANGYYRWASAEVRIAREYKLMLANSTHYKLGGTRQDDVQEVADSKF